MLSDPEKSVLRAFRKFYMDPGEMLCFNGPDLVSKTPALDLLVDKRFLIREKFNGAFSLTSSGYVKMRHTN